jgi:hypothetical protein
LQVFQCAADVGRQLNGNEAAKGTSNADHTYLDILSLETPVRAWGRIHRPPISLSLNHPSVTVLFATFTVGQQPGSSGENPQAFEAAGGSPAIRPPAILGMISRRTHAFVAS